MEEFLKVVKEHYVDFDRRARRKEFWMFTLISTLISIVLGFIDSIIGMEVLGGLYSLAIIAPSLAVGARRLHDIGKSGWWQLLWFIPVVGWIWIIVLLATDGVREDNEYGASPKYGSNEFDELGNN